MDICSRVLLLAAPATVSGIREICVANEQLLVFFLSKIFFSAVANTNGFGCGSAALCNLRILGQPLRVDKDSKESPVLCSFIWKRRKS